MISTLTNNTNNLTSKNIKECNIANNENWFELKNITDKSELSKQYATICQQHKQQKKWVLFINPDEASLEQLANIHGVDISKVLCVNVKDKANDDNHNEKTANLNIEQIKSVLCRGNCSAVILSNAFLEQEEILELTDCAEQGETQCLILKTLTYRENTILH